MCLYQCSWWRGSNQAIMATKASVTKRQPKTQQSWRSARDARRRRLSRAQHPIGFGRSPNPLQIAQLFFPGSYHALRQSWSVAARWCAEVCVYFFVGVFVYFTALACRDQSLLLNVLEYANMIAYWNSCRPMFLRILIILHVSCILILKKNSDCLWIRLLSLQIHRFSITYTC